MLGGEGAVMMTLDGVTKEKPAEQSAEQQAAAELVRLAQEQGLSLTGPDGLLKQLTKAVLETALNEGMTEHLGYEKHDPAGAGTGNIRNGTRAKTVLTDTRGPVELDVPRDRAATFEPQIVKKRQRRLSGVDEVVLSLYAKGLTTGEISAHFAEIYGASVSKETISRITDKVIEEMNDWAVRPLDEPMRRSSSTRSWSRSATGRSPTARSTPRSESAWPGNATSSGCGPAPVVKARSSG
jgi:putative transposase